jgi:type I restriction enzyme S subunit
MEVRPGYKQTEVGVIPQDWGAQTIDEIAFVTSGKRLPLGSSLVHHPTPHPYIRVTDMRPGSVDLSEIRYVPETVFPAIKRYRIFSADIFISVAGSLGIVGKVPKVLDGANLTENADRITNIKCSQDFLLHVLMSPLIQNVIASIQTVGAQPKLALTRIRKFAVPQPPLPEQRAIADALSDVDALLSGLDRLIAKKRDLKQAAMQQLLTGQARLPGFQGEWTDTTLFDLGDRRKELFDDGDWIESEHITNEGIRLIQTGNIGVGCFVEKEARKFIFEASFNLLRCKQLKVGDLLICRLADPAGRACVLPDIGEERVVTSVDVTIFRPPPEKVDRVFLANLFSTPEWFRAVSDRSGGTTHKRISRGALGRLSVCLPPRPEQAAIAAVLSDMDAELTALEARRDKTRALKQGMMQELLTGRTRLV